MKRFDAIGYIKDNYRTFAIRLDKRKYPEMIRVLEQQENVSAYVRDLINKDIDNHGEEKKCV